MNTIPSRTEGLERHDGFVPFYWDSRTGVLLLEITRPEEEFLYLWGLSTGAGSVDVGLDRGSVSGSALARWVRAGSRLLLELRNTRFRAASDNPALVRSVEESFAPAVIAALSIEAEDGDRLLVDATPLLVRDASGVARAIGRAGLGEVKLDEMRSAPAAGICRAFPRNTELEVTLTFTGEKLDAKLARLLVDGATLTVRQHHSIAALPDPGYRPRALDPRVGFGSVAFQDYAQPWDGRLEQHWIRRWRLEKADPGAPLSPPKQPIVYYLDRGIAEPIRSAMREGALWWNEAFEAAGFKDAFQVLDLPEDADPMDPRYSVIQWVHRADRGWSIGATWVDPRTGEILCGKPRMDSHRVRTVHNYWRSATTVVPAADASCCDLADPLGDLALTIGALEDEEAVMLRRIALLTAHEVGHTLGLPHNFGASLYGRGSVMEYFTPRIAVRADGTLDFSDAYMHGLGAWDRQVIRWGYSEFSPGDEAEGLERIVREGLDAGIHFLPETDPRWNPYDDGPDPIAWLREAMAVRRALLASFGPEHLRAGEPVADLDARLGLVYLFHRFAIEAAAKQVGGMEHTNALAGDGQTPTAIIPSDRQREALRLLLTALTPAELAIPERILAALPPPPFGTAKPFDAGTARAGYAFDQLAAARTLAALVLDNLLEKDRCARLVAFAARRDGVPALDEVFNLLIERTWHRPPPDHAALVRVVQRALVDRLLQLAAADGVTPEVRAATLAALRHIRTLAESS
ncbi:MAG: zinc-dependent metalloprotease, partial [Dehalococcoidia bacterium]